MSELDTPIHSPIILRNPDSTSISKIKSSGRKVSESISMSSARDKTYGFIFSDAPEVLEFFNTFPSRWDDVLQKARKYGELRNKGEGQNKEDFLDDLIGIFILPDKKETHKFAENIGNILPKILARADELANYAAGEKDNTNTSGRVSRSFIEYNGDNLVRLNRQQMVYMMNKLIDRNTDKGNALGVFNKIFSDIIKYCKSIFNIDIPSLIPGFKGVKSFIDLDVVAGHIVKAISKPGMTREAGVLFLKSLYAWGGLPEITKSQQQAEKAEKSIFEFLDKKCNWIHGDKDSITEYEEGDTKILRRSFQVDIDGRIHHITVESRVKSIESTLIKLLGDENYNNANSVRDKVGIRIFLEDNKKLPAGDKLKIIAKFSELFGKNRYIFKQKNYLDSADMAMLDTLWGNSDNKPIYRSRKLKARSGRGFRNASYSGYSRFDIGSLSVGTEVQFFDKKGDEGGIGEEHHSILDAKKVIQGWVRNSGMITLPQILDALRNRMGIGSDGIGLSGMTLEEGAKNVIEKLCVAYIAPDHSTIFSVKGFEHITQERYPGAEKYQLTVDLLHTLLSTTIGTQRILDRTKAPRQRKGEDRSQRGLDLEATSIIEGLNTLLPSRN